MQEKDKAVKARYRLLSQRVMKSLVSRRFDAYYCETAAEAIRTALSLIPELSSVSWGGSVTLEEVGLLTEIRRGNYEVIDRDTASNQEERFDLMRRSLLCDTYLTSVNAISEDGVLVNVDSVGNRVAAMAFGPRSVIVVAGMNKVCKTVADAVERARTYAAPINAQRCSINPAFHPVTITPCAANGSCANCKTEDCICSTIVATRMCKVAGRIKIILVGKALGF